MEIDFIKKKVYIGKDTFDIRIDHFPDGQVNLILPELNRKMDINRIDYRFTNSDDIFIFMQLIDILQRQEIPVNILRIYYLLCARQDRVLELNQPYSLKVIANIVNTLHANRVEIVEPHSERSLRLINNSVEVESGLFQILLKDHVTYCFPDKGARDRYKDSYLLSSCEDMSIMFGSKIRDPKTNNLSGFKIQGITKVYPNVVVLDDLCDGGGTFAGLAPLIRKEMPKNSTLTLIVTHAIQVAGIEKVAKLYDNVLISNSYYNWEQVVLPENVQVFDCINGNILNKD